MTDRGPMITLSMAADDVAVLTFDQPGSRANLLSRRTLDELKAHLEALASRTDLAGLVLCSGKDGMFIAGADINEFGPVAEAGAAAAERMSVEGRELLRVYPSWYPGVDRLVCGANGSGRVESGHNTYQCRFCCPCGQCRHATASHEPLRLGGGQSQYPLEPRRLPSGCWVVPRAFWCQGPVPRRAAACLPE